MTYEFVEVEKKITVSLKDSVHPLPEIHSFNAYGLMVPINRPGEGPHVMDAPTEASERTQKTSKNVRLVVAKSIAKPFLITAVRFLAT